MISLPRASPMLPNQLVIVGIALVPDSRQSALGDLPRLDLSRVHRLQQQLRPGTSTGQDSLSRELQMSWPSGIGPEECLRNFRIAEVLQASQQLGPKALRGFRLKQTEKHRNSGADPQIGQRANQHFAVWLGQAPITDHAQSRSGRLRYLQSQCQAHPCGIVWVIRPHLRDLFLQGGDRKSTRLNSSHGYISYAVFCLKKKKKMKSHT